VFILTRSVNDVIGGEIFSFLRLCKNKPVFFSMQPTITMHYNDNYNRCYYNPSLTTTTTTTNTPVDATIIADEIANENRQ